jgi:hypothetical protein
MKIVAEAAGDENIRILITEEAIELSMVEDYTNLRRFWSQLGVVLNEVEQAQGV